jgi:hypothetical protein
MEDNNLNLSTVYLALPFVQSFPFNQYSISLEEDEVEDYFEDISESLLKNSQPILKEEYLNFFYIDSGLGMLVSINVEDILDLEENSSKIKEMTPIKNYLEEAIKSNDISLKINSIFESKKFIEKIEVPNLINAPFSEILEEISILVETTLTFAQIRALSKLNIKSIEKLDFSKKQMEVLIYFLNFQLNYAMIILGLVIAAKIH